MQVGFVGLGTMGARMASNLQKAGYKLIVNDLRKDAAASHIAAGAVWADTPRAVAEQSDVMLTSLPEPPDVDKAAFDTHKALLDAIGDQARYIGPIGSATVAKLVHNMSGYAIVCALAETFAMGVKAGVEPLALWEAVRQGAAGRRYTFDALINQWLPGKYDPPDFALKLAHKDVGLATALGRELGLPMRICELAYAEMTEAMNRGWAGRDSRVVMMLEQERAGIEVKVDPERLKESLALPFPATQAAKK